MIYRIELIITSSSLCWSIQRTDYYPYGEPWRYPTGQQYLYSDKELTRADGRHAYTFPARTLLPSLPRFPRSSPVPPPFRAGYRPAKAPSHPHQRPPL